MEQIAVANDDQYVEIKHFSLSESGPECKAQSKTPATFALHCSLWLIFTDKSRYCNS